MVPKTNDKRQGARAMADDVASKPKRGPGNSEKKRGRRGRRAWDKASATRQNKVAEARRSEEASGRHKHGREETARPKQKGEWPARSANDDAGGQKQRHARIY